MEKYLVPLSKKINGREERNAWVQVFQALPASEEEKKSRGFLFAVVDLKAEEDFDCTAAGKMILNSLKEEYYEDSSGGILASLEHALDVSGQKLISLVSTSVGGKEGIDFNIVVVVLWGAVAYVARMGNAYFGVYRKGRLHAIGSSAINAIKTASGLLHEDDCLVLATKKFKEALSDHVLETALKKESLDEVEESLSSLVKDRVRATALLVKLEVAEVTEGEEAVIFIKDLSNIDIYPVVKKPFNKRVDNLFVTGRIIFNQAIFNFVKLFDFFGKKTTKPLVLLKKLLRILGRLFSFLISLIPVKKIPFLKEPAFRRSANHYQSWTKKHKALVLAVVFGIILLGSVFWNQQQRSLADKKEKLASLLDLAQSKYEEAKSLQSLNPLRAKTLLTDAKASLDQALKLEEKNQQALKLKTSLEGILGESAKTYRISDPTLFYDLTTLKTGAKAEGLRLADSSLVVLDKSRSALYSLSFTSREAKVLIESKSNLSQPSFLSLYRDNLYLFSPIAGLIRYGLKTEMIKPVVNLAPTWQKIVALANYHDNLYLLDVNQNAIWKYVPVEDGYSDGKNFLSEKEKVDLSKAVSLTVDGSVWVLTSEGNVLKFTRGVREDFRIVGLEGIFSNPTKIFTEETLTNLYLLDQKNKRIVVVSKEGEYLAQYVSEKFSDALDVVADEASKKLFVLTQTKIYNVDLR
ncbi:MAG: hypothetical protein M1150_03725 [Patescibacteria group bacterium]|nr:hypothetical protein [Patescibacteria group bacterium]